MITWTRIKLCRILPQTSPNTQVEFLQMLIPPDATGVTQVKSELWAFLLRQFSPHTLLGIQIRALRRPLPILLLLSSVRHFVTVTLDVFLWIIVLKENPVVTNFYLSGWGSVFLHNPPSSWCHLLEVHHSLVQQNTPTTWCCHPQASQGRLNNLTPDKTEFCFF